MVYIPGLSTLPFKKLKESGSKQEEGMAIEQETNNVSHICIQYLPKFSKYYIHISLTKKGQPHSRVGRARTRAAGKREHEVKDPERSGEPKGSVPGASVELGRGRSGRAPRRRGVTGPRRDTGQRRTAGRRSPPGVVEKSVPPGVVQ
ncbi:hypothetical protein H8959_011499 [Pygathrix nigripes]